MHLTKRRLVFEVVKAELAKGYPTGTDSSLVSPNKWISVDAVIPHRRADVHTQQLVERQYYFCRGRVIAKLPSGSMSYSKENSTT